MNCEFHLLVRTPAQFAGESLLGFVLRASEENGYETPWHLFHLAGIDQSRMLTSGLNLQRLARAFGRSPATLCGYTTDVEGNRVTSLAGHPVLPRHLRLGTPYLCPECITEHGFIPAWTDLAMVDGCPVHGHRLVNSCPSCGARLTWFRPGLLVCRCGFDLAKVRGEPIERAHAGLLDVVAAKVMGNIVEMNCELLPAAQMSAMSLSGLLRLIYIFGKYERMANGSIVENSPVVGASRVLDDWPHNFHTMLRTLGPESQSKPATGLRKQFERFYSALFKGQTRDSEARFVREAFIEFGRTHWGMALLDAKLLSEHSDNHSHRFLSLSQTAAKLGVRRTTARALLKREPDAANIIGAEDRHRLVVDIEVLNVPPKEPGKSYGEREAARQLGIPVSVLQGLRRSGHFQTRRMGSRLATFHEADLAEFEFKVAALAVGPFQPCANPMSLREALRLKFKSEDGKVRMVGAALTGPLRIFGTLGEGLANLLLDKFEVLVFLDDVRAAAFDNALTPREVAARLQCDPLAVPKLAQTGHLEGKSVTAGLRVSCSSVERFAAEYISVAALAKEHKTSSCKLVRKFQRDRIELLEVERGYGKGPQPFIARTLLEQGCTTDN